MLHPTRLVTAEELEKMPDDDYRYELAEGRLVQMSPVGTLHGVVTARLLVILFEHVQALNLGFAATEVGFKLATNPDTVRAPDIAFVRHDRIPADGLPHGFWLGPPDLAVEVLSPDDRPVDVAAKVAEYLASGVRLVWVVDPDQRTVMAHDRTGAPVAFAVDDTLDGAGVLPDFTCQIRGIFE